MKYKLGDKVRIRSDLIEGNWYSGAMFSIFRTPFKGLHATIRAIKDDEYYKIDIDSGIFKWTQEMFENKQYEFDMQAFEELLKNI